MKRAAAIVLLSTLAHGVAGAQERSVSIEAPLQTTLGDPIDVIVTVAGATDDEAADDDA